MDAADARAMVAQLFWAAPRDVQATVARFMVQEDVCALHAAWLLYGRARGFSCRCTPCESDPPVGSEVVVRVLVSGLTPADNATP